MHVTRLPQGLPTDSKECDREDCVCVRARACANGQVRTRDAGMRVVTYRYVTLLIVTSRYLSLLHVAYRYFTCVRAGAGRELLQGR